MIRLWPGVLLFMAVLAMAGATCNAEPNKSSPLASAILAWILRLREQALNLLLNRTGGHFLPSVSEVLSNFVVSRPAASNSAAGLARIVDVPRLHFVVFGPGGVLPDFDGPFSVDAVYRNKRWGPNVYFAVWSGYYEDSKVAVGADAHTTYSDICRFLAAHRREQATSGLFAQSRRCLHGAMGAYEHGLHTVVKQLVIHCERGNVAESEALARILGRVRYGLGAALFYWLHWTLRWNTVRGFFMLCMRFTRPVPAAPSSTKLQLLVPNTPCRSALRFVDVAAALVLASPATLARGLLSLAGLASAFAHTSLWRPVYLSHRLALLRRCTTMGQDRC